MAGADKPDQGATTAIRQLRREMSKPEEPLYTEQRCVWDNNGSTVCSLTAKGRDITGIHPGSEVEIHIYRDMLVVAPADKPLFDGGGEDA